MIESLQYSMSRVFDHKFFIFFKNVKLEFLLFLLNVHILRNENLVDFDLPTHPFM